MKMSVNFAEMADELKAVAHPERLAIMNLLLVKGCKPLHVKKIYETLHLEQSVVSRHLGILKRCGLLKKQGGGNNTSYLLNLDNTITNSILNCLQNYD